MHDLLLLGLNHTTAPLALREKFALTHDRRNEAMHALRERFAGCEAVLLSTCNRVELYASRTGHAHPSDEEMLTFVAGLGGVLPADLREHVYQKYSRGVIEHLFSVVSSLDSMVIGETQILGQVRQAYDAAHDAGAVAATLHPLFQRAVAVGKQVMTETKITEGRLSVGSVAVECAGRIFDHYRDKTVLCVGAGKMTTLVLQSFSALRPSRLLICNRSEEKAAALAQKFGGESASLDQLDEHLVAADVVVTSTGASHPIITRSRFEPLLRARRYRPIFLIDIALPRDVEPAVGELENAYLYNIDDLQQVVATTQSKRSEAIAQARGIVAAQVERYVSWHRAREMGPMIERLYQRHHAIAKQEVERLLARMPNLSAHERAEIEESARRIVNKLLHDPVSRLRDTDGGHGVVLPYLHAMEKLFQLEDDTEPPADAQSADESR